MEVSVQKCESFEIAKKSRSVDLKSVYAETPRGLDRKSSVQKPAISLKRENLSPLESGSLTDGSKRKRSRKEASLSSFGPAVTKKRRNGLNSLRLKPNGFNSGVGKPEKLSNNGSFSGALQHFGSDRAVKTLKKNDHGVLNGVSPGSSTGLSDGVIIIPKKPRGILKQRKLENTDSTKLAKGDYDCSGKDSAEPIVDEAPPGVPSSSQVSDCEKNEKYAELKDELCTDVGSLSQVSDYRREKKSIEAKSELSADVALPSQVSGGRRKNKSIEAKSELSAYIPSPSHALDVQRKKKSIEAKDNLSTDLASPSYVSDDQRNKKSAEAMDAFSADAASPSHVSDSREEKKSTEAKDESSTNPASPSRVSDGKGKKKCTEGKNKLSTNLAQVLGGKGKKKSTSVKNELSIDVALPPQVLNVKRKKKCTDVKNQLPTGVASPPQMLDVKKKKSTSSKDIGSTRNSSLGCIKREKQVRRIKKNSTTLVRGDHFEKGASLADDGEKFYGDFLEDDLEQNAARMLSSRFDPSCTGFSGSRKSSSSVLDGGLRGESNAFHPESSSADAAGWMLRPRKRNGKSLVRKRRHFYEVNYRDMDPYCIIKQRIRVFWPLDKNWYFGLVKDYDPVTRLHHVKYDDRDEEWIDLQNERFKLLLFPSEISGKFSSRKSRPPLKPEEKGGKKASDDGFGKCTESEPIIAWLTRSKQQRKLSSSNMIKKRRTDAIKILESSLSLEMQGHCAMNSNLFSKLEGTSTEAPEVKSSNSVVSDKELSFVYFRKKFHKRKDELDKTLEHDSVHGSSAASINILASVADSAAVWEVFDLFGSPMKQKLVTLKFSCQQLFIFDLPCGMEFSLWYALSFLQFGMLTNMWPMVHMEIVLVDNVQGFRLLLFEGSLGCATVLLCLVIRSFCWQSEGIKYEKIPLPFTSIGINLSGICGQGSNLLFLLYRFMGMKSSKWRYVEDKLKQKCVSVSEVPVPECTPSTFKNLLNRNGQMLCTSMYKNVVAVENFQEISYPDSLVQILPYPCLNINPTVCYIGRNRKNLPPHSLSSATEPSLLLKLHIKGLLERNAMSVSCQNHNSSSFRESPDSHDKLAVNGCSPVKDPSDQLTDITMENSGSSLDRAAASSGKLPASNLKVDTEALSVSIDGGWTRSPHHSLRNETDISGNSSGRQATELNSDMMVVRNEMFPSYSGSWQDAEKSSSSFPEGCSSPEKSEGGYDPCMNNINVPVSQIEQSADKITAPAESVLNLAWDRGLNPTGPRSVRHWNAHSSISPKYGQYSKLWQDDLMRNGFNSGSKKPRTQVSYSLPFGGYDLGSKRRSNHRKPRSYKKVKTDDAKRLLGVSGYSQSCHEQPTCNANVLVTDGDKGWRECGAQVVLESDDQKDWMICVKFSGLTRYAYKARHILQPGITNRHTHAMMSKGGKDWTLEFTDRSQWSLFREIHEECYNRNFRAAYVKNIPIPGVRMIEEKNDDSVDGVPFHRNSSRYYRQVGTEVDMALDPAHVLYDMDTDDEKWVSEIRSFAGMNGEGMPEVTDDMFVMVIDIFEKFAYAQQCDEFSSDEIEEFMGDVGPLVIVKTIYKYWRQKRVKKGMALIRQFQPACWVRYQQQLKEWESAMSKMHYLPDGSREKACPIKKPPMFAFCLRPRGLEVPNKLLKQRSHKKFISTGSHSAFAREQDDFHTYVRRTSGLGDERALVNTPSYESSDSFHSNDGSERFQYPELSRSNSSKKRATFSSPRDPQMMMPFSHNKRFKNGMDAWSAGIYESPSMCQIQRDGLRRHRADIDELKLRDASNAAQHTLNMAKMKREKASWLIHKADLAIHKATVALMIAEAMKESKEEELTDEYDI